MTAPLGRDAEFTGARDLTTKVLDRLAGKRTVSKQYVEDLAKMQDVKQAEKDVIAAALKNHGDTVPVKEFAKEVEDSLLPLKRSAGDSNYENVHLPAELKGNTTNYGAHVYQSPIKTSAGGVHFSEDNVAPNYFAHTRVEDISDIGSDVGFNGESLVNRKTGKVIEGNLSPERFKELSDQFDKGGKTRRVLELQSDLFQKGRLDQELNRGNDVVKNTDVTMENGKAVWKLKPDIAKQRAAEISKLKPYENTWHERVIREEVKQAAKDGKKYLQFPTGETAMKIEGLGDNSIWAHSSNNRSLKPENIKVGESVYQSGQGAGTPDWIITDVLGDGKFKAVSPLTAENDYTIYKTFENRGWLKDELMPKKYTPEQLKVLDRASEQFDISGKVDTTNPIYKFYESEVAKYLKKIAPTMEKITDPQGVQWFQIPVPHEAASAPVLAEKKQDKGKLPKIA